MTVQFHYAARSDVGLVRSNNQDSGYAGPRLLVLADGMGGPAGGDIASSVAVAHLVPLDADVPPADDLLPLLREAIEAAHNELMERSQEAPELAGLGTTAIAILRSGNKLGMVHIGDSRAYLLRGGELTQVTTDHTYVQHLVETGKITAEQAEVHPNRNMILRALGDTAGDVILDESVREARPGDRWLLCSDGLSGMVSRETIEKTLLNIKDPGECADALINLALKGGGVDNITAVVCDVLDTKDVPSDSSLSTVPEIVGAAANKSLQLTRATGSGSAAAKAAALKERGEETDEADEPPRRRSRWGAVIGLILTLALVGAGLFAGYRWTQTQYFVAENEGWVTIFRGIPQSLGPLRLAEEHERTDIEVAKLSGLAQDRLSSPITRGSLEEAESVVANLRSELQVPDVDRADGVSRRQGGPNAPEPSEPPTDGEAPTAGETPTDAESPSGGESPAPSPSPSIAPAPGVPVPSVEPETE